MRWLAGLTAATSYQIRDDQKISHSKCIAVIDLNNIRLTPPSDQSGLDVHMYCHVLHAINKHVYIFLICFSLLRAI